MTQLNRNEIQRKSYFLAIGGGMELSTSSPLVRKFIELSGGRNGIITILPTASDYGHEIGPMYRDMFKEMCDDVEYFLIDERQDADNLDCIDRITKSTGIFFTGGNQLRITSLLGGSKFLETLRNRIKEGIIVAGTSAGASAMSTTMITWGRSDQMTKGNLQLSPGLGFIPNMVIDSHFIKRGRISRLLHLVALNPGSLGIGLAEDTGILVDVAEENSVFEVIGTRQIVIVDGRSIRHSNITEVKENRPYTVTDVNVHVLSPYYRYNFVTHEIYLPEADKMLEDVAEPSIVSDLPFRPNPINIDD